MGGRRGLLFGLNYARDAQAALRGCVNDVHCMAAWLREELGMTCDVYTDEAAEAAPAAEGGTGAVVGTAVPAPTSAAGILARLAELAAASHNERDGGLDLAWVHFSGHGVSVADAPGFGGAGRDEMDGRDECIVPSDYATAGVVRDDDLHRALAAFHPRTRVVCVFDSCHSGTVGDLRFAWGEDGARAPMPAVENARCAVAARVISLSGCLDAQTSADAYDVLGDGRFGGALTGCLLHALRELGTPAARADVFAVVAAVRAQLCARGFPQVPRLCSSHDLARDAAFM